MARHEVNRSARNSSEPSQTPSEPHPLEPGEREEILVGSYNGVFSTSFRYPTFSLDDLLAAKGFDFVDDMLHMAACRAPFNLKRYAVLRDGWSVESAISDPMAAGFAEAQVLANNVTYALSNVRDPVTDFTQDFSAVLFDMLYSAWGGFRAGEIDWLMQESGPLDGKHAFRGFWIKPNKQIGFDLDPRTFAPMNFTSYTPQGGYDFSVPVEKMLYMAHDQAAMDPQGRGDWRACFKHWYRLDAVTKFWALALERWGAPVLLLIYPARSDEELAAAQKVARRIVQGAPAAIPDNIRYEVLKAPNEVFKSMMEACDWDSRMCALNVHANVLSTSEGEHGSTSAGAGAHQDSGEIVYDHLSRRLENEVTAQVIRRFVRYNYGDKALGVCPRLRLRKTRQDDVLETAQALDLLIKDGNVPARSKIVRQQMGWPALDPEEEKMLDDAAAAQEEAQQRLADARNSNQAPAMSQQEAEQVLERLTHLLFWQRERARIGASA